MSESEQEKEATMRLMEGYESMFQWWSEKAEITRRRIDLVRGVALGLLYGILGNLFVQFFYPVTEALALREYPKSFWNNVIVSVASLAIILYVTIKFSGQLKEEERKMELATDRMKRERYEIERLKKMLDKKSKGEQPKSKINSQE